MRSLDLDLNYPLIAPPNSSVHLTTLPEVPTKKVKARKQKTRAVQSVRCSDLHKLPCSKQVTVSREVIPVFNQTSLKMMKCNVPVMHSTPADVLLHPPPAYDISFIVTGEPLIASLDAIGDELSSVLGELEELASTCNELFDCGVSDLDMEVNDDDSH